MDGTVNMKSFSPDDMDTCAPAWEECKREFLVQSMAAGLDDKPGRRKVGQLLKCMGIKAIKMYDTFAWRPAVPAVVADEDNGVEASDEIPLCSKSLIETGAVRITDR